LNNHINNSTIVLSIVITWFLGVPAQTTCFGLFIFSGIPGETKQSTFIYSNRNKSEERSLCKIV